MGFDAWDAPAAVKLKATLSLVADLLPNDIRILRVSPGSVVVEFAIGTPRTQIQKKTPFALILRFLVIDFWVYVSMLALRRVRLVIWLRVCYALFGTDLAYGATRLRECSASAVSGTDAAHEHTPNAPHSS
eukprot:1514684-Rhodomonas_salina.1